MFEFPHSQRFWHGRDLHSLSSRLLLCLLVVILLLLFYFCCSTVTYRAHLKGLSINCTSTHLFEKLMATGKNRRNAYVCVFSPWLLH